MEQPGLLTNKKSTLLSLVAIMFSVLFFVACKSDAPATKSPETKNKEQLSIPAFSGDSAYAYIEKQLSFGFRIPGTDEHKACKDYFVDKFKSYGATVIEQDFEADFLGLKNQAATNIIASYNLKHKNRIIIAAHWDSRLIAEKDPDESKRNEPIAGADDGASGVGVILELARLINSNPIDIGVDFILFDAEDQGLDGENWCLGSQHWSRNFHKKNYAAQNGILLDMVGSKNPRFGYEKYSEVYAKEFLTKVWKLARGMGYGDLFQTVITGPIQDDHYFVNTIARIPMINIINVPYENGKFDDYHHTHSDDINVISKTTLRRVGQVVTAVIYRMSHGSF